MIPVLENVLLSKSPQPSFSRMCLPFLPRLQGTRGANQRTAAPLHAGHTAQVVTQGPRPEGPPSCWLYSHCLHTPNS